MTSLEYVPRHAATSDTVSNSVTTVVTTVPAPSPDHAVQHAAVEASAGSVGDIDAQRKASKRFGRSKRHKSAGAASTAPASATDQTVS